MEACESVIASGRYVAGPELQRFESAVSAYVGASHAVACSSGSDALVIALLALGIGAGDEVIVPAFSFFASVESVIRVGAVPRFVDIELDTLGASPDSVQAAISPKTRAVLAVHIAGTPARIDALSDIARTGAVPLIEDAAQAFGSTWRGQALGTFGELGCFSFQATKPLGALGDAGMVVTASPELAARCRRLTLHGATSKHFHAEIGGNYRMDAIHAAMLTEKLALYDDALAARERVARAYSQGFMEMPGLRVPSSHALARENFALYTVRVAGDGRRDTLAQHLAERGVETSVYYPMPLYRQPALSALGCGLPAGALPNTERACREVLSFPIYPALTPERIQHVIDAVRAFEAAP